MSKPPSLEDIRALVGHRFPGGVYSIAHWENFLLTECTGAAPLSDGLAHPVALFHAPILGAKTTIKEMFTVGYAESDFSIGIESYDWEIFRTLREETPYQVTGEVSEADRCAAESHVFDRIQFRFELFAPEGALAARSTITWHYRRSLKPDGSERALTLPADAEHASAAPAGALPAAGSGGAEGGESEVPPWLMERVRPERMRTMAAILRDPNPVHWDPSVVEKLGFGHHTINQGPLGLSYMVNMLHAWAGPESLRRLFMRFPLVILDGDRITARGRVTHRREAGGERLADCDIWLDREGTAPPLLGKATVALGPA